MSPRNGPWEADRPRARHEMPIIDERALVAARAADVAVAAARERGSARWLRELDPLPDILRDGDLVSLRRAAIRVRAAYGVKDSLREALPEDVTEPLVAAIDKLLKELRRMAAEG